MKAASRPAQDWMPRMALAWMRKRPMACAARLSSSALTRETGPYHPNLHASMVLGASPTLRHPPTSPSISPGPDPRYGLERGERQNQIRHARTCCSGHSGPAPAYGAPDPRGAPYQSPKLRSLWPGVTLKPWATKSWSTAKATSMPSRRMNRKLVQSTRLSCLCPAATR